MDRIRILFKDGERIPGVVIDTDYPRKARMLFNDIDGTIVGRVDGVSWAKNGSVYWIVGYDEV